MSVPITRKANKTPPINSAGPENELIAPLVLLAIVPMALTGRVMFIHFGSAR